MNIKSLAAIVSLVLAIGLIIGCDDDDSGGGSEDSDVSILKGISDIKRINENSVIELDNGYDLVVTANTKIYRLRPSCSGFNSATLSDLSLSDLLEYKYLKSEANFAQRVAVPFEIRAYRRECIEVSPEESVQYVLDSDFDGVGDIVDNCVDTPNSDQSDIDNDGVGDECDADPNDPAVQ